MFELGTVVKVKGFSTKMVVEAILESGQVECVWFDVGQLRRAPYDADKLVACGKQVMVCKLQLQDITTTRYAGQDTDKRRMAKVRFGAVWEGSQEKQAMSENAIFGDMTPQAEFAATINNGAVVDALLPGKKYYVTFTEAPD